MKVVSLLGFALFTLTAAAVGLRTLLLWHKTRQLPELTLSLGLWCTGVFGFALGLVSRLLGGNVVLAGLSLASEYVGCAALVVFGWRVFRAGERWATRLYGALLALLVAGLTAELVSAEFVRYANGTVATGPIIPLGLAARGLGPAVVAVECVRYHAMLRRRAALGLAKRAVVHRVALWGLAQACTALGYVIATVHRAVWGTGLQAHDWALGSASLLALTSAIGIGLAFFPPGFYRRWVDASP